VAALLIFCALTWLPSGVKRGDAQRSYFGVYRVQTSGDGQYHTLVHGTTLHGAQRIRDDEGNPIEDPTPATYYYENSPMAQTVVKVRERLGAQKGRYGVIGLGAGSLACHSKEGEAWRIFEIDPVVIGIASDPNHFSFLSNCQPDPDIVIGDARLTIAKEPNDSFDLIIVDAFSSDAVPVHLMTAEALRLYLSKLKPNGIALLHISNRYLDLDAVLGATVKVVPGAEGFLISDDEADGSYAQSTSTVAVFGKSKEALEPLRSLKEVSDFDETTMRPWTDDYSDILGPFLSKMRKRGS
jgi:SAM-dependent methyltransferase